jgi:hypothetical protein
MLNIVISQSTYRDVDRIVDAPERVLFLSPAGQKILAARGFKPVTSPNLR